MLFIELLHHIYIDYNLIDLLASIQQIYSRSYQHNQRTEDGARTVFVKEEKVLLSTD